MTFWADSYPKARISHRCADCGRTIDPGETYRKGSGMDGGTAWTWKECSHCLAYMRLSHMCDDWWADEGYGWEMFADYEAQGRDEERWKRQYRRQWRTSHGTLFPIPSRVAVPNDDYPGPIDPDDNPDAKDCRDEDHR